MFMDYWRTSLTALLAAWRQCSSVLLVAAALGYAAPAMAQPLVVYVVPQTPAEAVLLAWSPVLKKIGDQVGVTFTLKFSASIPEFERRFSEGVPDIAYMNPYHAIMAKRAAGYEPIIRDGKTALSGILVVQKDSKITSIKDIEGKEIAFPSPNAFGASLYMRSLLKEREHIDFSARYLVTHSNVYRQVATGRMEAGGGVRQSLAVEPPDLRAQLRIIYETPPSNAHPIVVHPRVPTMLRDKIQKAFLQMAKSPENSALLQAIQIPEPRVTSYKDYESLTQLHLEKYVVQPKD
jgi:phosphonate transport system substrate-binding protein